jgi:hypothetical protein
MGSGYSQLSSQHLSKEQLQRVEQKFKRLSGGDGRASVEDIMLLVSTGDHLAAAVCSLPCLACVLAPWHAAHAQQRTE